MTSQNPIDDFSYHDYTPTWRSASHKVDLRPVQGRLERRVADRLARFSAPTAKQVDRAKTEVCAQAAVGLLFGGISKGKRDVELSSGQKFEVFVETKWWPYTRFAPSAAVSERLVPKNDIVICACPMPPFCFEETWVVGWVPLEDWHGYADKMEWGRRIKRWRNAAEVMNDELVNPRLPVGMSCRRWSQDPGVPEYIAEYFGSPGAQSSSASPNVPNVPHSSAVE